jgi:hypothetical protein
MRDVDALDKLLTAYNNSLKVFISRNKYIFHTPNRRYTNYEISYMLINKAACSPNNVYLNIAYKTRKLYSNLENK